jgi:hypothetical protein
MDYTHKRDLLESRIYELVFSKCRNIEGFFSWNTNKELHKFPNAKSFFSNLHFLEIKYNNFNYVTRTCRYLPKYKNFKVKSLQ